MARVADSGQDTRIRDTKVHMPDTPVSAAGASARFFDNYLSALDNAAIPKRQRRWYVRRVEEFIKAQAGRKIKTLPGSEVRGYINMICRKHRLVAWQFRQRIEAIRIL